MYQQDRQDNAKEYSLCAVQIVYQIFSRDHPAEIHERLLELPYSCSFQQLVEIQQLMSVLILDAVVKFGGNKQQSDF